MKFVGNLSKTAPNKLLKTDNGEEFGDFFFTLALIFNDLKGLMMMEELFRKNYDNPAQNEISNHTGNYHGISIQIERLYAGLVHEFLKFLSQDESKTILSSIPFQLIVKKIPTDSANHWKTIEALAMKSDYDHSSEFAQTLLLVRNNVSYHYHQSGPVLRQGLRHFFNETEKSASNEYAYYSLGQNMSETRFYYIDAAVQGYMTRQLKNTNLDVGLDVLGNFSQYQIKIRKTMECMNDAIFHILRLHLRNQLS